MGRLRLLIIFLSMILFPPGRIPGIVGLSPLLCSFSSLLTTRFVMLLMVTLLFIVPSFCPLFLSLFFLSSKGHFWPRLVICLIIYNYDKSFKLTWDWLTWFLKWIAWWLTSVFFDERSISNDTDSIPATNFYTFLAHADVPTDRSEKRNFRVSQNITWLREDMATIKRIFH